MMSFQSLIALLGMLLPPVVPAWSASLEDARKAEDKASQEFYQAIKDNPPRTPEEQKNIFLQTIAPAQDKVDQARIEERTAVVQEMHKNQPPPSPPGAVSKKTIDRLTRKNPNRFKAGSAGGGGSVSVPPGSAGSGRGTNNSAPKREEVEADGSRIKKTLEFGKQKDNQPKKKVDGPDINTTVEPGIRGK